MSAKVQTAGANIFGRVAPGSVLTIQTPARPALIRRSIGTFNWIERSLADHCEPEVNIILDKDSRGTTKDVKDHLSVLAVKICNQLSIHLVYGKAKHSVGLILHLTENVVNYRRIGTISDTDFPERARIWRK